jgi:phage terminase large subunit
VTEKSNQLLIESATPKAQIIYKKARHKVLYGGRASSKSWEAFRGAVVFATKYSVRILCVRELQNSIKDSSHRLIKDTIERLGLSEFFEVTRDEIRCIPTGALFIFRGVRSNPESVKSLEAIDICIVEEAQCLSQESIDILEPTIRGNNSEIWWLFNPRLPSDPVSVKFLSGSLPRDTLIEKVNYYDNRFLPEALLGTIQDCKEKSPEAYEHIWEGNFCMEADNLFIPMKTVILSQNRVAPLDLNQPVISALDVARSGDDKSVLVIRRGPKIIGIWEWQKLSLTELSRKTLQVLSENNCSKVIVDGSGVGGGVVDILKEVGSIETIEFNGAYKAGPRFLNQRVKTWYQMREWMETQGAIPSNLELQGQLSSIEYLINNSNKLQLESKIDMKKRGLASPDIADSLSMTFYKPENHSDDTGALDNLMLGPSTWG